MTHPWISAEWAEAAAPLTEMLPAVPGAAGSVSLAVSGGRRQEAGFHWRYDSGKPGAGAPGIDSSADLVLLLGSDDALDVLKGDVDPSVAFMRGRLKASGDGGLLLGFLKSTVEPSFEAWRRKVSGLASETAS